MHGRPELASKELPSKFQNTRRRDLLRDHSVFMALNSGIHYHHTFISHPHTVFLRRESRQSYLTVLLILMPIQINKNCLLIKSQSFMVLGGSSRGQPKTSLIFNPTIFIVKRTRILFVMSGAI